MHPIIRLINRNITISLHPGFLIWQVIFPLIYIFVAGFAYAPLINQIPLDERSIDYPAFLASGMIGFNIMNSTLVTGIIIWTDKRTGMFQQILVGPFTKRHYIISNLCTISIIGLISAALIAAVGYPVFFESVEFSVFTIPLIVFGSIVGGILFGSLASIISIKLRSSEGFGVVINTVFLFFAFLSTTFYPVDKAPELLRTIFYLNPLTYLVDTIRAGIFGVITDTILLEMLAMTCLAGIFFVIALKLYSRLNF